MSRIVLICDDVALASMGATIDSAGDEDPEYPASNLLDPNRRVAFRTVESPSSTVSVVINLGQVRAIEGFGVHYVLNGNLDNLEISVSNGAGTMAPGTMGGLKRDWCDGILDGDGLVVGASAQTWTVTFTGVTGRLTVGKVILGLSAFDPRHLYSQGSEYLVERPSTRVRTYSQVPIDMPWGDPRKTFDYTFRAVTNEEVAEYRNVAGQKFPFALVDSTEEYNHVVMSGPGRFSHVFDSNWDCELPMEQIV